MNRLGDDYFSEIERNGHIYRIEDLEWFATLGIHAIRYPVLWEHTAPNGVEAADWSWPDQRLHLLRKLRINPIVGLVHHGSGPRHTSLIDLLPSAVAGSGRSFFCESRYSLMFQIRL